MKFQLEYTKADFEGIKSSNLSEIESLKKHITVCKTFIRTAEENIIRDKENVEFCRNPELIETYEAIRIKNHPMYLGWIESQNKNIDCAEKEIERLKRNIEAGEEILNENKFPLNIEFNLKPEGYTKQIVV